MSVIFFLVWGVALTVASDDPPPQPATKADSPFTAEFEKIKAAIDELNQKANKGYAEAKTEEEREALIAKAFEDYQRERAPLTAKALALLQSHEQESAAVEVLVWILNNDPRSSEAGKAADLLIQHHLKVPKTQETASRFVHAPFPWTEKLIRAIGAADLPREKKAEALFQLAQCMKSKAALPGLLKGVDQRTAGMMERLFGKEYLAQLRSADAAKLEEEAVRLLTEVAEKYGDEKYGLKRLGDYAKSAIYEIQNLGIGKTAPEIRGEDIDGQPMKLSDFRGKVVMLDFWGHW